MKRIELLRKTGICITAFALSAAISAANPMMMTAFASDATQAAAESSGGDDGGDSGGGSGSESGSESGGESGGESGSESGGSGSTDPSPGDSSGSGSGQSGSVETPEDSSQSGNTGSGQSDTSNSSGSDTSGNTSSGNTGSGNSNTTSSDTSSDASSSAASATPTAPSEAPAADTQQNQPRQTGTSAGPTGKYKDKGTTLNPGENPTGYDQTLNYTGNNADLIASQNIVSGLSIIKDDFRFYTIDKVPAVSAKEQSVLEDMDTASREIGLLSEKDLLYILSEEDDGWLYIESGNVRGFIKKDDIKKGSEAESSGDIPSFAEETVPASENKAFTYKRCTTKSTVVDKDYAVADVDTMILESTSDTSREIGYLAPGSLCYIIQQADEKWSYVESGNVRGFVRSSSLTTGSAAKKIVAQTGEVSMTSAQEYVAPADNKALYYSLNSVHDGVVYSSVRTEIVEAAAKCIGNPYVWGGTSLTNGADCSGFVQTLYSMFGYNLPRVADAQSQYGIQIPISDAAPGDLIFFASNGYVYHVALYAGDGMTIEAYSENRGIIATPIGNRDAVWATRVIED